MLCPDCQGEVPAVQFYCPHCRAEMPRMPIAAEMKAAPAPKQKKTRAVKRSMSSTGVALHSRKLFELAWQGMQLILAVAVLLGSFVAYQRVNWQSAASRMNELASAVQQHAEAAGVAAKPQPLLVAAQHSSLADKPQPQPHEKGKPLALQATATAGLLIVKSPMAARIFVDGKFAGTTPHSFIVAAGEHQLQLQATGYRDWSRAILMRGNQQVGIMAALEKTP